MSGGRPRERTACAERRPSGLLPSPLVTDRESKRPRLTFEKLVRSVSAALNDPVRRTHTVQVLAEELGEHPWRVSDALDAYYMMGGA